MGTIVKSHDLPALVSNGMRYPVIYCREEEELLKKAISISIPLAIKLQSAKPVRRTMRLEQYFQQVLTSLPDYPVIRDIDVMFNPAYEIDVLRIICSAAKTKPFSLIWPGRCEDGKLIYAEEGYLDYRVYEIENYDVTCVV